MGEFSIITLNMALPNGIGLMENVWLHITLENGRYVPIKGKDLFQYYSHSGNEWPKIFNESTKREINISSAINNIFNSTEFSFSFECYDSSYWHGTYVCTFTINGKGFYTEERSFCFETFDPSKKK